MKSKDKTKKYKKISIKNLIYFFAFILIILYSIIFYNMYFVSNNSYSYAKETISNVSDFKLSNAKNINIDEIINDNVNEEEKAEYSIEEIDLEYITKYENNASLPKGTIQVIQEGRQGKQEILTKKLFKQDELIGEEQVSSKVTKAPINKVVQIGTAKWSSNYKVKIGDILHVTSDRLSVMTGPSEETDKIATLNQREDLKVLAIDNEWYKIASGSVIGYVKAENTSYIDDNTKFSEGSSGTTKSKAQLNSNLSFNMALNKPSGLSIEQFKKVLTDSKDTNKIFENNSDYFYYIEKQYNINGVFVAAVGIHESAWGTSKIAREKNNLFGYGAYDSNPYNGAYNFSSFSESIDLISRVFVKYYLNTKGTSIYGGEKAAGTYYNGPTLNGINTKYATDKNWANGVYNNMKYLYNKL